MRLHFRNIIVFIICISSCIALHAADRSYYFKHLKVEDGLSQNTVRAILQDSKGFMWFGTKGGLNRYDGCKFKTFLSNPADSASLGNDFVNSLYEDREGNIWVGTDNGLYIYDTHMEAFRYFDLTTCDGIGITKEVIRMVSDKADNLWIGVKWGGLFKYNFSSGELSLIAYVDGSEKGLSSNGVRDICIDSDNIVWLGTIAGGLNMYNPADGTIRFFFLPYPGMRNDVTVVMEEGPNSLLLGTSDNGVLRFDKIAHTMSPYIHSGEETMYVRSVMKPDNDNLWLGTESGLYTYNIPSGTTKNIRLDFSDTYSLSDNAIYSLYADRENGIWIGTYFGGVNYLSPDHNYFDKYFPSNDPGTLSGNAVREFQEDAEGNFWIGTEDNGLNYFNPRTGEFRNYTPSNSELTYNNIHGLMLDGDKLFVGYFMRGMDVIDLNDFSVRNYTASYTYDGLGDNCVFALKKTVDGRYWVGTISGLYVFDIDSDKFTRITEIGAHAFVYDIMEDSRGLIWFATYYDGLFSHNPRSGEWIQYLNRPEDRHSLGYNKTISLTEDSRGNIWIATEGGGVSVYHPSTDKFRTYTTIDGLPNNVVHKILEDDKGRMWISTNNGLAVFDPGSGEFTTYTYNKGLLNNQFNYKSGIRSSDGRLYFGSIQGFVRFDPLKPFSNRTAPPVAITRFELFNREVVPSSGDSPLKGSVIYGSQVDLDYRQSSFSFEFAALSYNASEMNRYAYKLEGLEEEWNYISNNQRVNYSNVPYGNYVFRVRGANSDGLWNNEGTSLSIRIRPPFMASAAGIGLEVILGLGLLFLSIKLYRRRSRQKHQRVVEKMRAAEDIALQKAKMSFFTSITHEIRTPLSLIKAPFEQIAKTRIENPEIEENLEIMGSNINRLLNLTNELLDFSKAENRGFRLHLKVADVNELLSDSLVAFRQILRDKKLELDISLPPSPVVTCVDSEILVKIFTNLFSNASKFAAQRIAVKLEDEVPRSGMFRLSISNDGEIIHPANRHKVFKAFFQERKDGMPIGTGLGLPLVKQLAELHGGHIYIDAETERENIFIVEIPKNDDAASKEPLGETSAIHEDEDITVDGGTHIIIAEDESTMRRFLYKSLSKRYKVTACGDGEEVIKVLKQTPADLIITDLVMPRMDGFHLCNILKTDVDYSHIPVIILTAKASFESKMEGLGSGADAYIEKPFSIEHLYARIDNLLGRMSRLREAFRSNPDMPAGSIATNATDEAFLGRVNEIIMEHIQEEDFSIDQMAEIMNISRSNLYRKLKGISHMAPYEFIRLCRLKRAADLLHEGNYRINEICYLVGFNSPSYFTKCFQRQFGVSPKDYIRYGK